MLAPDVVREIRRLLAEDKLSYRKIARRTGVSRGSVAAIAQGKRADRMPSQLARAEPWPYPPGVPPERCPGCGGLVYMPCRACRARWRASRPENRLPPPGKESAGFEPLGVALKDEHQQRYQQVRARRIAWEASREPPGDGFELAAAHQPTEQ